MAQTKIEWTTTPKPDGETAVGYSFNPWRGCQRVSEGCRNCYAETLSRRNPGTLGEWGPEGTRAMAAESYWKLPVAWNKAAAKAGVRHKVFCASLADVFEGRPELVAPRKRLFELILATPYLDWLLLTKRPENVNRMMGPEGVGLYTHANGPVPCPQPNLWIGTSVEDQKTAEERIPHLLNIPAVVRFLSVEPLLAPVDLTVVPGLPWSDELSGLLHWCIVGGESGANARQADMVWFRDLRDQCAMAGIPFFMKQLGKNPVGWTTQHQKGGDIEEFPDDLRIRQFPVVKGIGQ